MSHPGVPHIAIIGGGITGLAAAEALQRHVEETGQPVRFTLLERQGRVGGKIQTERFEEYVIEGGPDSVIATRPHAVDLARRLGLGDQLEPTMPLAPATSILSRGRILPLPVGMALGIPGDLPAFLASPVLSPWGRARALLDLALPPRHDEEDESVAAALSRRMGSEIVDHLAGPLLAGIYNSDATAQSLMATFPQFRQMERQYGSLIRGAIAGRRARGTAAGSPFLTLRDGMGSLVAALETRLRDHLRIGDGVATIARDPAGGWRVAMDDGTALDADGIILATPAHPAAQIVVEALPELATRLQPLRTVSTGTISLAYDAGDLGRDIAGFGMIIPSGEGRAINALTLTSRKFAHRAPLGSLLVRVFFGGTRRPAMMALDDAALLDIVRHELRDLLGITAAPRLARIWRWHEASPQYDIGHLERVAAIRDACPPDLAVCGGAYGGVGIPDCVRQGQQAAEALLHSVRAGRAPATRA
jgi:protoporphyrinogen/coproporphyrinogen III oxidase